MAVNTRAYAQVVWQVSLDACIFPCRIDGAQLTEGIIGVFPDVAYTPSDLYRK